MVLAMFVLSPTLATADGWDQNVMAGPVIGASYSSKLGWRFLFGVEGGVGAGAERINGGAEKRDGKLLGYLELDPWFLLGGSIGLGIDEDQEPYPILGLWEGVPLRNPPCGSYRAMASFSIGFRYTGAWEFYAAPKAGIEDKGCSGGFI